MLNKKYKCPVCGNKAVNVFFLSFDKITCSNCDSHLRYSKRARYISSLSCLLLALPALSFETVIHPVVTIGIGGGILTSLYLVFFGELEEYPPQEPKFNLNKFLDNLRSPNSNK